MALIRAECGPCCLLETKISDSCWNPDLIFAHIKNRSADWGSLASIQMPRGESAREPTGPPELQVGIVKLLARQREFLWV